MSQPSCRILRRAVPLALVASVALASVGLLSSRAGAQAMGGLGHRSSGNSGGGSPAPQQAPQPPARVFSSPAPSNNAPVFSAPAPGQFRSFPPPTVSPVAPPAATVGPVIPNGRSYSGTYSRQPGYRFQGGPNRNAPVFPGRPSSVDNASRSRVIVPEANASSRNDDAPQFTNRGFDRRSIRVTTPIGQRGLPSGTFGSTYLYSAPVRVVGGPSLLGGYYYGNYTDTWVGSYCYPSVYSVYLGFPQYIVSPSLIVIGEPYYPVYWTSYLPFYPPTYQVTYNQNNYYVASEQSARDIEAGGETAKRALKDAYPADSYQAAFADIERAWREGRISLLRKHLREDDVKLSVYVKGKYSYSIASGDYAQITRDAFDRLNTTSFRFDRLRKAKNGDVTAYGKHVYRTTADSDASSDSAKADETVPFSTDGSRLYDNTDNASTPGEEKTVYVSYTLRHHENQWYIVGVNSSPTPIVN